VSKILTLLQQVDSAHHRIQVGQRRALQGVQTELVGEDEVVRGVVVRSGQEPTYRLPM